MVHELADGTVLGQRRPGQANGPVVSEHHRAVLAMVRTCDGSPKCPGTDEKESGSRPRRGQRSLHIRHQRARSARS
jgi:hypothetical protein